MHVLMTGKNVLGVASNIVQVMDARGRFCSNHGLPQAPAALLGAAAVVVGDGGDTIYLAGGRADVNNHSLGKCSKHFRFCHVATFGLPKFHFRALKNN